MILEPFSACFYAHIEPLTAEHLHINDVELTAEDFIISCETQLETGTKIKLDAALKTEDYSKSMHFNAPTSSNIRAS